MRGSLHLTGDAILAIDQGTTNTKGLCVGSTGACLFAVSATVPMSRMRLEWLEQSPEAVWASVEEVVRQCLAFCRDSGLKIAGVAVTNQRETAVAWDRVTGQALGNAISWQCRRSAGVCSKLAGGADLVRRKAGLPLDPLLTATKWRWMLEESEAAPALRALAGKDRLWLGTIDSWLIHKLCGGSAHVTDHSNASRTGLLHLESLEWDDELLQLFDIPRAALAQLVPSMGVAGICDSTTPLKGLPIVAVVGDSHAALVANGGGRIKATYGTGSSLMVRVETLPACSTGLARTVAWSTPGQVYYALEGNIVMAGACIRWLGEFFGLPRAVEGIVALSESVEDSDGVVFVPAMAGLGAPYWDASARGAIFNLGPHHRVAHVARAAVEAIAHQVADVFELLKQSTGVHFDEICADGGATRNAGLMQFQADILNCDVLRSKAEELSALGAAWLGGIALDWWPSIATPYSASAIPERFSPRMDASTRALSRSHWKTAVRRTLTAEDV